MRIELTESQLLKIKNQINKWITKGKVINIINMDMFDKIINLDKRLRNHDQINTQSGYFFTKLIYNFKTIYKSLNY